MESVFGGGRSDLARADQSAGAAAGAPLNAAPELSSAAQRSKVMPPTPQPQPQPPPPPASPAEAAGRAHLARWGACADPFLSDAAPAAAGGCAPLVAGLLARAPGAASARLNSPDALARVELRVQLSPEQVAALVVGGGGGPARAAAGGEPAA